MILIIDNYDSFTYNLYQALAQLGPDVQVHRNDAISVADVERLDPGAVVISPGPGRPAGAGVSLELLDALESKTPVLGVCLGHQCLVEYYGGTLEIDSEPVHGKWTPVHHSGKGLFAGLPSPIQGGRYHSLIAASHTVPGPLEVTAWTGDGVAMGVQHRRLPRFGVQFHPESILTPRGAELLKNFVLVAGLPLAEDVA